MEQTQEQQQQKEQVDAAGEGVAKVEEEGQPAIDDGDQGQPAPDAADAAPDAAEGVKPAVGGEEGQPDADAGAADGGDAAAGAPDAAADAAPAVDPDAAQFLVLARNLPMDATEAELRSHFEAAGQVASVMLHRDERSGFPLGRAVIGYLARGAAEAAISTLHDQCMEGYDESVVVRGVAVAARACCVFLGGCVGACACACACMWKTGSPTPAAVSPTPGRSSSMWRLTARASARR